MHFLKQDHNLEHYLQNLPIFSRTTGIILDTATFAVFAVIPSTLLASVPSNDITPTKTVRTIPKNHTIDDFKYFANLLIWTLSDNLETIIIAVIIETPGRIKFTIIFDINSIINSIIGSNKLLVAIFPVYIIRVMRSGTNVFINPTKFCIVFVIDKIKSEKLLIIIVTINMYCT